MPLSTRAELIGALETMLADLKDAEEKSLAVKLSPVVADIGFGEACARLESLAGGGTYITVEKKLFRYGTGPWKVEYEMYDGLKTYKGATLQAALNALIAAHTPQPANVCEDEQLADAEASAALRSVNAN